MRARLTVPMPLIGDPAPGLYEALGDAHDVSVITVPDGAVGVVLWFEQGASDATIIGGRVGFTDSETPSEGLDGTDDVLGYHPAVPVEYKLPFAWDGTTWTRRDVAAYLHVAAGINSAVVRGSWLVANTEGD